MTTLSQTVPLFDKISPVTDYLFVSGHKPICMQLMKDEGITGLINAANIASRAKNVVKDYLPVFVNDSITARLDVYFDDAADLIERNRVRGGKTLVHCAAGISRSPALCMVYLIKYHEMSLRDAYLTLYQARPVTCPNPGFWRQMLAYEKEITGTNSVKMLPGRKFALPDLYYTDMCYSKFVKLYL